VYICFEARLLLILVFVVLNWSSIFTKAHHSNVVEIWLSEDKFSVSSIHAPSTTVQPPVYHVLWATNHLLLSSPTNAQLQTLTPHAIQPSLIPHQQIPIVQASSLSTRFYLSVSMGSLQKSPSGSSPDDEPLDGPLHASVGNDEWRRNIEHLSTDSSPGVEDSSVECTSKRALSVGTQGVCIDTLLRGATCKKCISLTFL